MNPFLVLLLLIPAALPARGGEPPGLAERYRTAHEAKDVAALKSLVYWEGAVERTREIIEKRLTGSLDLAIESVEVRALTGDEEFSVAGYRSNLTPVGWLAVTFEPPEGDLRFRGIVFVVGEKEGERFIAVAEKAP